MHYRIEPIFLLFPLLCLFFHLSIKRKNKWLHYFLIILFLIIYSFSLNGSDIEGYRFHYKNVGLGASSTMNEQEVGYYYLMKFAISLGLDYITFRVFLLSILSLVLFYSIRKFSDDFPLSLYFVSSMFVIYTISAYRQFIVMTFSIWWLYQFSRGKKVMAVIGMGSLLLFHITAILPFGCMLIELFSTKKSIKRSTKYFVNFFLLLLFFAFFVRVVVTVLLRESRIESLVGNILGVHATPNPSLFSFGLLSRVIFLLLITYLYYISDDKNETIRFLYWYYYVSLMLYIMIPLDFVMGRLMNNAHILSAILIPMLKKDIFVNSTNNTLIRKKLANQAVAILEIVAFIILINQLLNQNGYTPYLNVLLGDKIIEF